MMKQNSSKVAQGTKGRPQGRPLGQHKIRQWPHDFAAALGFMGLVACISSEPLTWETVLAAFGFGMLAAWGTRGYRE